MLSGRRWRCGMVPGGVLGHSFDSARGVGNDVDGDPRVGGHQRISSVVNLCLFLVAFTQVSSSLAYLLALYLSCPP